MGTPRYTHTGNVDYEMIGVYNRLQTQFTLKKCKLKACCMVGRSYAMLNFDQLRIFTTVILIHCSKKLQELLSSKLLRHDSVPLTAIGNWNAHVFLLNRQKHLMLINAVSYYAVIIEQVKKDSLKNIELLFTDRLIEQLIVDRVIDISDGLILLSRLRPIVTVSTNNNRKAIGTMNDFISIYKDNIEGAYWQKLSLVERNSILNDTPVGAGKNENRQYGFPKQDMQEIIKGSIM